MLSKQYQNVIDQIDKANQEVNALIGLWHPWIVVFITLWVAILLFYCSIWITLKFTAFSVFTPIIVCHYYKGNWGDHTYYTYKYPDITTNWIQSQKSIYVLPYNFVFWLGFFSPLFLLILLVWALTHGVVFNIFNLWIILLIAKIFVFIDIILIFKQFVFCIGVHFVWWLGQGLEISQLNSILFTFIFGVWLHLDKFLIFFKS